MSQPPDQFPIPVSPDQLQVPDLARLQNAADFVLRTVLETLPEPASGSAWLRKPPGLVQVAFVGQCLASRQALRTHLTTALGEGGGARTADGGVLVLGPVKGHFSSAMVLPVPGSTTPAGFLLLTSDVPEAFDRPKQGLSLRMAAQLGQYWARTAD